MVTRLKRTVLRGTGTGSASEIGGALLGTATEDANGALVLDVSDFAVLPSVNGSDHDYSPPVEQMRSLREGRNVRAIGYFRTQGDPDLGLRPHETALAREFPDGAAVALLLSPAGDGRVLAGLIHSDGMEFHNTPAKRFQFDEAAFGPLRPVAVPPPTPAGAAPVQNGRRTIVPVLVGAGALLAGAAGAYWWSGGPTSKRAALRSDLAHRNTLTAPVSATPGQGLDLAVNRALGGLMVSWKGAAVNASGGELIVTDGDLPSEIVPLTADDVRKGKIFYRTNSERLRFRVELVDSGGRRWSDSVLVLGGGQAAGYSSGSESRVRDTAARSAYREQPPLTSSPAAVESRSRVSSTSALQQPPPASPAASGRTFQPPRQQAAAPVERTVILDAPAPMPVGAPSVHIAQAQPAVPAPPLRPPAEAPPAQSPVTQNAGPQSPPAQKAVVQTTPPSSSSVLPTQPATGAAQSPPPPARQYTGPVAISQVTPRLEPAIRSILVNDVEVEVKVQIDASGRVVRAEALQKLTGLYEHIERAAVDAAERWRFQPATINGKNVPSVQTIKFLFRK
jgi:protein TonB